MKALNQGGNQSAAAADPQWTGHRPPWRVSTAIRFAR